MLFIVRQEQEKTIYLNVMKDKELFYFPVCLCVVSVFFLFFCLFSSLFFFIFFVFACWNQKRIEHRYTQYNISPNRLFTKLSLHSDAKSVTIAEVDGRDLRMAYLQLEQLLDSMTPFSDEPNSHNERPLQFNRFVVQIPYRRSDLL